MTSLPGLTCPECGHAAKDEVHLFRARRRWRVAGLAAATMVLGLAWTMWPAWESGQFWAWVPTDIILRCRGLWRSLPAESQQAYTHEYWNRDLTPRQYNYRMGRVIRIYLDPEQGTRSERLSHAVRHYRMTHDGMVRRVPAGRRWQTVHTKDPWTVLTPQTAGSLIDSMVFRWRLDTSGSRWEAEIGILGRANRHAATIMLDRMFSEDIEWPLYIAGTSQGLHLAISLEAIASEDAQRRARAATALYLAAYSTTRGARPPGIFDDETALSREALLSAAGPAANAFLELTDSPDRDVANRAARVLLLIAPVAYDQIFDLYSRREAFDPDVSQQVLRTFDRMRRPRYE
jgi:hypothetical protein